MSTIQVLQQNYQKVTDRIERAAESADRDSASVRLVSVTKYVDASVVRMLFDLGCHCFGESRPQVLWKKSKDLEDLEIEWHMIGHLQTNKVRRTLPDVSLFHSGDSVKLFDVIDAESKKIGKTSRVLCEVNISGDPAKHGFPPETLAESLTEIASYDNVQVVGLMAMASRLGGANQAKTDFEKMAILRDQLKEKVPDQVSLEELSMGMSGDFEQAIECGATLVRVGSVLFEGI